MITLLEVLNRSTAYLERAGVASPKFEAQLLMAHVLGMERLQLFMNYDRPMAETDLAALREPLARRAKGEPYAYIVSSREFYSREFAVGPGVLIPRPDTEALVEAALPFCEGDEVFVADIGAGSGCIGLTLALECPGVKLYAVERSEAAAVYLRKNVEDLDLTTRVGVLRGDLMEAIPGGRPVDVVVSNPPYIRSAELEALEVSKWEPREALDGGHDGLELYRRLIPQAAARARKAVLVEIGHDQADAVSSLMRAEGLEPQVRQDLAGNDRVVWALVS